MNSNSNSTNEESSAATQLSVALNMYTFPSLPENLRNGHIIKLLYVDKITINNCLSMIKDMFSANSAAINVNAARVYIDSLFKNFKKKKNSNLKRDISNILMFLGNSTPIYKQPVFTAATPLSPQHSSSSTRRSSSPQLSPSSLQCSSNQSLSTEDIPTLRNSCASCTNSRSSIKTLISSLEKKSRELRIKKKEVVELKRHYAIRVVNQRTKRNAERRSQLRANVKKLESTVRRQNNLLRRNKEKLSIAKRLVNRVNRLRSESKKLHVELRCSKTKISMLEKDAFHKQNEIDDLKSTILELKEPRSIEMKVGGVYRTNMRKCIYHMLQCDVPVQHCGFLANKVVWCLAQQSLTKVPSKSYAAQLAYEMGIISSLQLAEFLLTHKELCLSWDATSLDGNHINEIHVVANVTQLLSLDVRQIPGGTASDYTTHIVSIFKEIAGLYAKFCGLSILDVLASLHRSISCTLTDRAAVNRCVVRQLCEELHSEILELHCNLHPLDSFARAARSALASIDKELSISKHCFGPSAAVNVIHCISKLRFKAGTGDPEGFKVFLRSHGLPLGTFVRYVGNRLHVLFHLAGLVIQHLDKLKDFFKCSIHIGGTLKAAVLKDLENNDIIDQIWTLGVIGKIVTGPWMSKFYTDNSNLDMIPILQQSYSTLASWVASPNCLLNPVSDLFGQPLQAEVDLTLFSLVTYRCCSSKNVQSLSMHRILAGILKVMDHQLQRYLSEGELAKLNPSSKQKGLSAPCHNMGSERTLAILDRMARKAPNATSGFFNGKIRARLNKSLDWLESKDSLQQENIVAFARKEGYLCRQQCLRRREEISTEISHRRAAKAKSRDDKKRAALAKKIAKYFSGTLESSVLGLQPEVDHLLASFKDDESTLNGSLISHTWEVDDKDVIFYGRIQEVRKKRSSAKSTINVTYWSVAEIESDGEDYDILPHDFFADIVLGDVIIF